MALSEADDAVAKIKERIRMMDAAAPLTQKRDHERIAALLEAQELLVRAADSITRGHVPALPFAVRLLDASQSLAKYL